MTKNEILSYLNTLRKDLKLDVKNRYELCYSKKRLALVNQILKDIT
jgi:hypothetical protein